MLSRSLLADTGRHSGKARKSKQVVQKRNRQIAMRLIFSGRNNFTPRNQVLLVCEFAPLLIALLTKRPFCVNFSYAPVSGIKLFSMLEDG